MNRIVIGVVVRSVRMSAPPSIVNAVDERDARRILADWLLGLDIDMSTDGEPIEPAGMNADEWMVAFWQMAQRGAWPRLRMTLEVMD